MGTAPAPQLGVNTPRGHGTHEGVAESLAVAFTPLEQLL